MEDSVARLHIKENELDTQGLLNPVRVKEHFPIFNNNPLTQGLSYLDNAATSQKPESVIQAMDDAMRLYHSPVNRGFYPLAEQTTDKYEQARERLGAFIGAVDLRSVIFTPSATDSINQVAQGFLLPRLSAGQQVWVTRMEHHANYLPWQQACEQAGATLRIIELNEHGELALPSESELFSDTTAMIAVTHTSNVLGVTNDIQWLCSKAKAKDIPVLIDAAQAMVSNKINVNELGCDFLVFSAHKMFGPTGVGLLYIAPTRIEQTQPLRLGGGMVDFAADSIAETTWSDAPHRFEAGSPNLVGAVGFAAACDFVDSIGQTHAKNHIHALATRLYKALSCHQNIHIVTPSAHLASGIVSFYHNDIHAHDLAQIMGDANVAVRAGHHCAQPLLRHLGVSSTLRISISIYNTEADIQAALSAIENAEEIFA
ncbi:cysteine desulfurase [Glaciecola sp. XM2]|uniref:aminotransferase class V-fold PLP-dependent enzyme n=1 Tax=Glaciecola sp. XM2 TaxID=1914931 RepID=UPI001BDE7F64|nr:cysteine desulfurase [Glaciecola sp. XM2]